MVGIPPITTLVVPGGADTIEAFIVGQLRELRADEDNDSLRLHDGVKEGGYEFLNRDQSDARYQIASHELDGFSFGAQEKGILCRVGPASYKIRKVQSTTTDITITNPRGTAGDFDLNLAATVPTAHTWDAIQTFNDRIVAIDGLTGDTYGVHHGNVIGDVAGNLTGDSNGTHTGPTIGDVDLRGHTLLTDPGQILETQIDPEAWIRRGVPLGAILMWNGSVASIPESWALCDGTNGTPDLRSRFIMGAGVGGTYHAPGTSGGATSGSVSGVVAASGSHTHPLAIDGHALTTAEMPAHKHLTGITDDHGYTFSRGSGPAFTNTGHSLVDDSRSVALEAYSETVGGGGVHTHTGNTTDSGAHTHDITLDAVAILPPYYALCFIMKIV